MSLQGKLVRIDGKQATVETEWAQGKHRVSKLNDGRVILDLAKLIEAGKAQLDQVPESKLEVPMPPVKKVQFPGPADNKKWNV
jgi:hypothetical protein